MRWLESLARGFPWAVKQALPTQPLAWPEEPGVGLGTFLGPNPQGMGSLCTPRAKCLCELFNSHQACKRYYYYYLHFTDVETEAQGGDKCDIIFFDIEAI